MDLMEALLEADVGIPRRIQRWWKLQKLRWERAYRKRIRRRHVHVIR